MKQTPQELIQQAEQLFNEGRYQELVQLLSDDLLTDHGNGELYAWRARAHDGLGEVALTIRYVETAIDLIPTLIIAHLVRGIAWSKQKEYAKAIEDYSRAIQLDEKYIWAYLNRGLAWYELKEYTKAVEDYNNVIRLNEKYATAYYCRGKVWYDIKEYAKAIEDYTKTIELDEKYIAAYYARGLTLDAQKEYTKAIEEYTKAIQLDEKYVIAYNGRGNAWYNQKEYVKAIEEYTKAIQLDEKYAFVYRNRGLAWNDLMEFDKAIDDCTRAIQLDNEFTDAYIGLGVSWHGKKDYIKAIENYTKAILLNEKQPISYFNRAISYTELKRYQEAIDDYRRYVRSANNSEDYLVKVALAQIEELNKKLQNDWYNKVDSLVSKIKQLLLFNNPCVTHYTSLSGAKAMILGKSPFRLSEGTFLNDTSEGRELFKYLSFTIVTKPDNETIAEPFIERPFIGSFVADDKHDDLALWRMYGKEAQAEAKGCTLTIYKDQLINNLKGKLMPTENKTDSSLSSQGQFTFYKVAYRTKEAFLIPGSSEEETTQLNKLMKELHDKIKLLDEEQKKSITQLLNDIAYLFKTAEYQYEYEVRLVVQGVGFPKVIDKEKEFAPPRVYIELVDIAPVLHKITLGPKVEKADEWAAAFNYHIKENYPQRSEKVEIVISHLPFK
jgi:tetratricopeptide (TPR) repeat protein